MTEARYKSFLDPHLRPGFLFRELVTGAQNKELPPREMWPSIVPALVIANELRKLMMGRHGAKGLLCVAAYRPAGGARNSQHKHNRALDLDLFPTDYNLAGKFATEAVRLFCSRGATQALGLGLYGRPRSCETIRVHIDVGAHPTANRGWQIFGGQELGLGASDIKRIATREGLVLPP